MSKQSQNVTSATRAICHITISLNGLMKRVDSDGEKDMRVIRISNNNPDGIRFIVHFVCDTGLSHGAN